VIDECFLAGTPVTMADGSSKPIEQVRAGDWVMSFDQKTGETKPGRVKRTMQNPPHVRALSDSLPNPEDFARKRSRITLADI
jgi:hypothetical protein